MNSNEVDGPPKEDEANEPSHLQEVVVDAKGDGDLPKTVSVLNGPNGSMLYLVGTAHFSKDSMEDVGKVISSVVPHIIVVELCEERSNILLLDEEVLLREAKNISLANIRMAIKSNGVFRGIMYVLLLNASAECTRQLGMAPGGEFRRAFQEAKKLRQCAIQLGDRPINITIQRAIASLSWWETFKFLWELCAGTTVSSEEIEQCKEKHNLNQMLEEMSEKYPPLNRVLVQERDKYLTYQLQLAVTKVEHSGGEPVRVVGIVGIGHMAGIMKHWGHVKTEEIPPLMIIPEPSRSTIIIRKTVKMACMGFVLYVGYKIVPKRWLF